MKNSTLVPIRETLFITLGEVICSAIVCGVFLAIGMFDSRVILGTVLGSLVIILNFLFMSIAVNRAIDKAFELRDNYVDEPAAEPDAAESSQSELVDASGPDSNEADGTEIETDGGNEPDGEPSPELDAAMRFANEQSVRVSRVSRISFIIRTVSVLLTLVVALISDLFNPIATVIPMLMLRPIIMAEGLIRGKK